MTLEVDNVELYFKDKCILNGIYLKAETGKVTGVLGSNGSGKSCLLNIIFGSLQSKYKLIRIDGKPITSALYKTKLASFLPQFNFTPDHAKLKTVFKLLKIDWNDFVAEFESFSSYKDKRLNRLSGGERRVIETYLILKGKNKIALLDEPFSHLSPLHIQKIIGLISEEKHEKIIIITDHMFKNVINTSDNLYLIKNRCSKPINDLKELETYNYVNTGNLN
ncbi:ATP-binding cassette domain-containing protein [Gaetbulibacter sp. NE]|uniref:ATP-binding cassette domain-containing protein n=1 Tax=Gaetbulibacter sp. NE TaxID=2982307 RepID=UPI0021D139CE|nr:ABC transporter ATP-binding protein [Gaetbulibacter sp. NE]